jgi:hypothetical protein
VATVAITPGVWLLQGGFSLVGVGTNQQMGIGINNTTSSTTPNYDCYTTLPTGGSSRNFHLSQSYCYTATANITMNLQALYTSTSINIQFISFNATRIA